MTELFGRSATVIVDTIKLADHKISFKIEKTLKPQPNTCEISIWNLNKDQRAQLEELRPKTTLATKGISCQIDAGYQNDTALLWLGDLRSVQSVRSKADWITTLSSGDGEKAWQNARLHVSYGPNTPVETVLRALVRALGVGEGNVGRVASNLKLKGAGSLLTHGTVISGPVAPQLDAWARSADLEWSVQDGRIQFLNRAKALGGKAVRIASDTGMVGSPTVDQKGILTVKVLFIHDIRAGALIVLDADRIKGNYRIQKATWNGDTFGGDWTIEIEAKRY